MIESDLDYYRHELKRLNATASVYPLTVVVSSDTAKTKHLSLNKESIQAIRELLDIIENLNQDERTSK